MNTVIRTLVCCAALAGSAPGHALIQLAPTIAGPSGPGQGANASFVVIDGNWRGSSVLWDESNRQFGPGAPGPSLPIREFTWGTGLWGRADWDSVFAPGSTVPRLTQWDQLAPQISFADTCYNDTWGSSWGFAGALTPPPGTPVLPVGGCPEGTTPKAGNLDNWASRFSGYIRITTAGVYNFGVLYDDGFFFDLYGESGQKVSMAVDYLNPRDRRGFAENLALSVGLYRFEMGAWDRLEAGVVELSWLTPGTSDWTRVPTAHLLASVPLPGSLGLMLAGALGWGAWRRRRHPAAAR